VPTPLRLLCVLAHPDDETLGCGGILAKYAVEGVETYLVTATRGERGRIGGERPGPEIAGPVREAELRAAAAALGIREVHLLGCMDGELDRAPWRETVAKIAAHVRRIRPQVVVTFGADGAYGHVDHVAISQLAGAALLAAADPGFAAPPGVELPETTHAVAKLYWMADTQPIWSAYQRVFGRLAYRVDGAERQVVPWREWQVSAAIDTSAHRAAIWRAVDCHRSQTSGSRAFAEAAPEARDALWRVQTFYRVHSLSGGGREVESDLFAGLR
jgi:LmbE family N-acetylglucosaminyl deacetylase